MFMVPSINQMVLFESGKIRGGSFPRTTIASFQNAGKCEVALPNVLAQTCLGEKKNCIFHALEMVILHIRQPVKCFFSLIQSSCLLQP